MKKAFFLLTILAIIATLVISCAPAAESTTPTAPTSIAGAYLNTDFTDAASLRNQLAYGTLLLDGTPNAVSPEQAGVLVPLWQAIIALSGDTVTADEELLAVQDQIVAALTPEQLQGIAGLNITNTMLNTFYAENGIVMPTPIPGVTKVPGSGKDISDADRAATQAAAAASGVTTGSGAGQAAKTLLFDKVVEYLTNVGK